MTSPTLAQYQAFDSLFAHFNRELFGGSLPSCMLTFSRHARANGFFAPDRWADSADQASGEKRQHEIALNPDTFASRTPKAVASTLAHEMVHLWQQVHGKPSRGGYHNTEWGQEMDRIGLTPSNTGEPGGKRTGQQMTHYIAEGGPFARVFGALPEGWFLPFVSGLPFAVEAAKKKAKRASKSKYTCPSCETNVWGKPGLEVMCNACGAEFELAS